VMRDRDRLRLERIADVEGMGRLVNAEIVKAAPDWQRDDEGTLRCECADATCSEPVRVTRAVYERVREDPMLFLVGPGHDVPGAEDVVERTDGYWIVRKHEALRTRVEASAP